MVLSDSDEVIGEIATAGCRNQPGEKIEIRSPESRCRQPSQRRATMARATRQQQGKNGSNAHAPLLRPKPEVAIATKAKAIGKDLS
jgi:hypothetical protein